MRVETFTGGDTQMRDRINKWLSANDGKIEIKDMHFTSCLNGVRSHYIEHFCFIVYEMVKDDG